LDDLAHPLDFIRVNTFIPAFRSSSLAIVAEAAGTKFARERPEWLLRWWSSRKSFDAVAIPITWLVRGPLDKLGVVRYLTMTRVVRYLTITLVVRYLTMTLLVRYLTMTRVVRYLTMTLVVRYLTMTLLVRYLTMTLLVRYLTMTRVVRYLT